MNRKTYESLAACRFLSVHDGHIYNYTSPHNFYKYEDVSDTLYKQLDEEIDFNNIIISFPGTPSIGSTGFYGPGKFGDPRKVLLDYCTYIIDVKNFLHQKGIKFKNGKSLIDRKYSQQRVALLIVQDGIAYVNDNNANPWSGNLSYNQSLSMTAKDSCNPTKKELDWTHDEIKISREDLKKLNLNNKQLMFSGFFIRKCEELGMKK